MDDSEVHILNDWDEDSANDIDDQGLSDWDEDSVSSGSECVIQIINLNDNGDDAGDDLSSCDETDAGEMQRYLY